MSDTQLRCRSFCFLEREGERWTAFLITYPRADGQWRGYFTFRSATQTNGEGEVRTADLFLERAEAEVDQRARGLGRPLLLALLDSAVSTAERRGPSPQLHRWFRQELARSSAQRERRWAAGGEPTLQDLHRLYDSYRFDQVAHLIALIDPDDFREMVEILLAGRRIDFRERDRFQLAMSVVQDLERRLPLPPFEVWAADYMQNPLTYRRYSAELHSGGELP